MKNAPHFAHAHHGTQGEYGSDSHAEEFLENKPLNFAEADVRGHPAQRHPSFNTC